MASPDPPEPAEVGDASLRRLEERLDRASDAAERLLAEAAGTAARAARAVTNTSAEPGGTTPGDEIPAAGWQLPRSDAESREPGDVELLAQVIRSVREVIPPELERRLAEALRELLLALRALIDWYLERSELRRAAPSEVQDIPIS